MALHKIRDFYPDYREQFGEHDLLSYSLYSGTDKIGSVDELLVDDEGRFRYLVINTGAWIFGKKVLLPIGSARIDYNDRKVYVDHLTREQVENLPEYDPNTVMDYDYEERVRNVYRPKTSTGSAMPGSMGSTTMGSTTGSTMGSTMGSTSGVDTTRGVDTSRPIDATPGLYDNTSPGLSDRERIGQTNRDISDVDRPIRNYDRNNYRYDYDPDLYNMNDRDHQTLRLYEERLVAGKNRQKTGEVTVGKRVETETQHVSVPVEKERVVVERVTPTNTDVAATVGEGAFQEGEVARMEVYEEVPDIRKEAFVREEVQVRKEVDRDTVESDETVRQERLDIDKDGNPIVSD